MRRPMRRPYLESTGRSDVLGVRLYHLFEGVFCRNGFGVVRLKNAVLHEAADLEEKSMFTKLSFFNWGKRVTVAVLFLGVPGVVIQQASAQTAPPPVPAEELPAGSQVLASGPVHEAFAMPVTLDAQNPIVVSVQPPASLQETPPAERPEGAAIVWVPGYWAWDADRNDFIWVSGCWRNPPPSTYWIPGYWLKVDNGWQWVSGFWSPVTAQAQQTIEYLPMPPAMTDVESVGTPPQPDQIWVSGCWYWVQNRYVWRSGYWMTQQAGWVWMPSHYVWTPRGYIFCQGSWDYALDNRGVLFTPAYFPPAVRIRSGFAFCPSVCVDLGVLRLNLFAYPRYHHYYFGDYYDNTYRTVGIYPWFQCQTLHIWYDPLFVYDRWHYRHSEPRWAENRAHEFEQRRDNRELRPPRTFAAVQARMSHPVENSRSERPLVQTFKTYESSNKASAKFERVNVLDRKQLSERVDETRNLREQRNHWESPVVRPVTGASGATVRRPAATETRPAPAVTPSPVIQHPAAETRSMPGASVNRATFGQHPAVPETRSVPAAAANPTVTSRSMTRPVQETRQSVVTQPQAVRSTGPERVVVPTQSRVQNQTDARSTMSQVPSRPAEEQRTRSADPTSGRGSADQDRDASSSRRR